MADYNEGAQDPTFPPADVRGPTLRTFPPDLETKVQRRIAIPAKPREDHQKAVAALILEIEQPGDRVAIYHNYFNDLPVWLDRRITVVGYHGELEHFLEKEDYSAWFCWTSRRSRRSGPASDRILLVLRRDYTDHIDRSGLAPVYPLGEGGNFLLYSNRPDGKGGRAS